MLSQHGYIGNMFTCLESRVVNIAILYWHWQVLPILFSVLPEYCNTFYRAMHVSAKRGIAIACRLSVRLSVCLKRW